MANLTCASEDLSFGPTVVSCRQGLDFTLQFEESVFDLLPACLVILLSPLRIWQLSGQPKRVFERSFAASKLTTFAVLAILKLVLAITWVFRAPILTRTSLAAAILSFCEVLAIAGVSSLEHARNIRPSSLLSLALVASIVLDTIRARTFIKLDFDNFLTALFTAAIASKASILLLESKDKRQFLRSPDTEKPPEETSGLINRSVFWWLTPLLRLGYSKILSFSDLWHLDDQINAADTKHKFYRTWQRYSVSKRKFKLVRSTLHSLIWLFLSPVIPNLLFVILNFSQPFLISRMITFVTSDDSIEAGYLLLIAFAVVYFLIGLFSAVYWHEVDRWLTVLRGCLVSSIYQKTLTLDLKQTTTGASVALMSTDVERAILGFKWVHEAASSLLVIPFAFYMLYHQVGLAFFAPLFVLGICTFLASKLSTITVRRQKSWLQETQKRVHFTSSVIASMRGVKIMGIVSRIERRIQSMRIEENRAALRWRLNITVGVALSNFSSEGSKWFTFILFAIIFYTKQRKGSSDEGLNVNVLFTSLAILNIALQKLRLVIQVIPGILNAFGCFTRIEEFLAAESKLDNRLQRFDLSQVDPNSHPDETDQMAAANASTSLQGIELSTMQPVSHNRSQTLVEVAHLTAGWSQEHQVLHDISLEISTNQVTILSGPVGCGKSTLLQTLLGETTVHEGFVNLHGSFNAVAYCPQTPWLVNKSIRENIVGKSLFDVVWYKEVIRCCALLEDLKHYDNGDKTSVGSKGVSLSGGQKQRIALARAVYSKKQILILDDIFSGLDAVTEERISIRLLGPDGLLRKNRHTVILATHSVHLLPTADKVIIMDQDGSIKDQGTWAFLSTNSESLKLFRDNTKLQRTNNGNQSINDDQTMQYDAVPHGDEEFSTRTATDDTSRKTGDITVYKHYLKSVGWKHSLIFLFLMIVESVLWNVLTVWLNKWSGDHDPSHTLFYMGVYTGLAFAFLITVPLWVWHFCEWPMSIASLNLHSWQLATLMKGTMSYFSGTDVGVTTNRFSQDFVLMDTELPLAMLNCLESSVLVIGLLTITLIATPWIGLTLPFLGASFYYLQRFYLRTSRQVRLLDIEAKSPLYTHFQETLAGISTVRAFNWENAFRDESENLLSLSQKPYYYLTTIQRWLAMVLDFIVAILACAIAFIAVQLRHSLSPGYIGLALLNTMSISEMLKILIIYYTDLETSLGAIARMRNFSRTVPQEDEVEYDPVTPGWPNEGSISIRGLSASHKPDSEIVLRSIDLNIPAGSKVGFCGRSGSGKSSLVAALFRLLDVREGLIIVDGIDITTVPVNTLRGRFNALSQEPFFLAGSVRENLSYASVSDDEESWPSDERMLEVLARVGLKEKVSDWEGGLDASFDPEGSLSHGERQLFCLARAMLKPSTVVVLDEFTSSVDIETDNKMQHILRQHFCGQTIITVAHRLNTILDYDIVIVLEKGAIIEKGNPKDLLQQPRSAFKSLYDINPKS